MLTNHPLWPAWRSAMDRALEEASLYRGATSPNPPVGAAGLDASGQILGVAAHERAGTAHAEAKLITELGAAGRLSELDTLLVTLEPCNHTGRTPPCTEAVLRTPARRVIYAVSDPNPKVAGKGAQRLRAGGREVHSLELEAPRDPIFEAAKHLIAPFSKWATTGLPYITVKSAWRTGEHGELTMIPPPGQKTFTSEENLALAHELRKRADAILTGSGTILADNPSLTVRRVSDHPGKKRYLAVLDRSGRVPKEWLKTAAERGFELIPENLSRSGDLKEIFTFLGTQGVLEVLVETGPKLTQAILDSQLWDEHVRIVNNRVEYVYRNY